LKAGRERLPTTSDEVVNDFNVGRELAAFFLGQQVGLDYLTTVRVLRWDPGLQQTEITRPPHAATHTFETEP
jgi:hypothetical protein